MSDGASNLLIFDRELIEARSYWMDKLSPAGEPASLRPDHPRPATQALETDVVELRITGEALERLDRLTGRGRLLTYTTLLAALEVCLYKHGGSRTVVVGSPPRAEHPAPNVLAVRDEIDPAMSFRALLVQLAQTLKDAYARQRYPHERLIRDLGLSPGGGRFPLFDVMMTFEGLHADAPALEPGPDLVIACLRTDAAVEARITFRPALHERATVERFAGHLTNLLTAALADTRRSIAELSVLSDAERRDRLVVWNATRAPFSDGRCVHELFEARAARTPHAIAASFATDDGAAAEITYAELNARANRLARRLRRAGAGPDVPVAICLPRSPEMLVGLLGVLKAGSAYVPLDPAYPGERLRFMLEDARARVLLTRESLGGRLLDPAARHDVEIIDLDREWDALGHESPADVAGEIRPEHLAYVIYTSGSTGTPKGVAVAHRGLTNMVETQIRRFGVERSSRVIQLASLSFDASISEIMMALCAGATLVLGSERQLLPGRELLRFLAVHAITHATIPPSTLAVLDADPLPELGTLIVAGEACPPALIARWSDGRRMLNAYGPTEITVCATIAACDADRRPHSIGGPIANTEVYVLDGDRSPAPLGVPGELYVGGVGVARGYLGRPGLTAERFVPDPFGSALEGARLYRTGDLTMYLGDGAVAFLGRIDQQVKVRGYRIELGEIEAVLGRHPDVAQAVVLAREDQPGERRLVAYVVPRAAGVALAARALRELLRERLPEYMVPWGFVVLDALPLTPNGKIDRRALPAPGRTRGDGEAHDGTARTPTEEIIAGIWTRLLDADRVGIHDDFFLLGGHSLLATRLISQIRETLGVDSLLVRHVFESPTVARLAAHVDAERAGDGRSGGPPMVVAARTGPMPLSFAQQRLWFLDQLEGRTSQYNMPIGLRLDGPLDRDALARALGELVRRHEVLRTSFPMQDGVPVQLVAPETALALPVVDLRALDAGQRARALARETALEAERPFELAAGPLLRVVLFRLDTGSHVLLLTMHHIVTDGWSLGILVSELSTLYEAFSRRAPSPLRDPALQYADYSIWQRQWLTEERLAAQLAYWKQRLAGAPALLELPGDRPRPAAQTFRGGTVVFSIPAGLTAQVRELSRRSETTVFMTLLAAFQALLQRYTGQDDIVVGTDVANRTRTETEPLVGFFVNQLALRTDLSGDPTFGELLRRVREVCLDAYAHQDLPFQRLLDGLQLARDLSRTPLFQVKLVLQNAPFGTLDLAGLTVSEFPVPSDTTTFDLVIAVTESAERLDGFVSYRTELFDEATVRRLLEHWQVLLDAVTARPERHLAELPLLTAAERHQLLTLWNDTRVASAADCGVHRLVAAQAARVPDAMALSFRDRQLTYRALDDRANALARHLRALGVGPETIVGVFAERSIEMVVGLLAILKAGGAYLPLDPAYPFDRLAYILDDARPPVLLTEESLEDRLPAVSGHLVFLDDDSAWAAPARDPEVEVTLENLAYVIYTSGSTGRPKAVMIPHRGLLNLVEWHGRAYGIDETDRATQLAGTAFDASVWEVWPYLVAGAALVLTPPELVLEPADLRDWLVAQDVTVTFLPTPLAELVLPLTWPPGPALRLMLTGGDKLHAHPPRGLPFSLVNNYGPTENTVVTTWVPLAGRLDATGIPPIGRPVDNCRIYIVDGRLGPVPIGVPGELIVGGRSLARGYLNQPGQTGEKFVPEPFDAEAGGSRLYRTGDLCRYLPDGAVEFLGRLDSQVSLRGFRVELGEIESVLSRHGDVRQAAVVLQERGSGDAALMAYVVLADDAQTDVGALLGFLRKELPAYMIPAAIVALDALPLTPNGKLDRRALPSPDAARKVDEPAAAPRTSQEEILRAIWAGVLKRERVGIHDNFFELGGDSILSIQVIARAAQQGIRLTARQMFQHQTIAELAAVAGAASAVESEQGPVTGEVPLTPIQRWFFEQEWRARAHYTQSMLLSTPAGLDPALLEEAARRLIAHHDALRLRFEPTAGGWRQTNAPPDTGVSFVSIDLSAEPPDERAASLTEHASTLQASLDLSVGPLLRLVYFDHGAGEPGRLLLVVHHLAVDGVSWRILLEDLTTAHGQLARGEPVRLPDKTSAFRDWARRLDAFGEAEAWREPWEFWRAQPLDPVASLPVRAGASPDANTNASARIVTVSLSADETRTLLQDVLRTAGAQINDVLLTAVLIAFHRVTGAGGLSIDLEAHGREDLFDGVDLSRTVGWFTAVYPVSLALDPDQTLAATLGSVKARLAATRRWGIHFGMLRYLSRDEAVRETLASRPRPEISFNYLGQLDSAFPPSATFGPAGEGQGPNQDPRERRAYLLEIGGLVLGERLQVDWRYSTALHRHADVERLAQAFVAALRAIIADHGAPGTARGAPGTARGAPETARRTPADFPLAGVDQDTLDRLLDGRKRVVDIYPLSPMQQGMLFHALAEPGSHLFFEQVDIRLAGAIDPAAFARAWQIIVDRHGTWRSGLEWSELTEPLQLVYERAELSWADHDWRALPPADHDRRLDELVAADRARGLALAEPPLMRGALVRVADDAWHFLWTHHHIMMDGWCLPVLLGEAFVLHEALRRGEEPPLPAPRPYRDFIAWLGRQDRAAAERFWREKLGGFGEPTRIRVAPAPALAPGEAKTYPRAERWLSAGLTDRLRALAREHRLTLNTLVQGAWAVLLSRYSGETDVVFGATSAGRPPSLPGVETMIGLFLNTVPVRLAVPHDAPLVSWLQDVLADQFAREPHAFCSLVDIQGWSGVPRGLPLFESLMVFENYPMGESLEAPGGVRITGVSAWSRAGYPLTLVAGGGVEMSLDIIYDSSRFTAATVGRMLEHLELLLAGFVDHPARRLGDLPILTETEARQLAAWNDTRAPYAREATMHARFESRVERRPDAVALVFERVGDDGTPLAVETLTYRELSLRATRVAHRLRGLGVGPDVPVGILAERSLDLVIGMLGILKAGGAFVPLDSTYPLEGLATILDDVQPPVVLLQESLEERLPASASQVLFLEDATAAAPSGASETSAVADNLAYVMYTSGSTDRPKGTGITHRNVMRLALTPNYTRFTEDDVFALLSPIGWDASTLELWAPLLNGGRLTIFPPVTPSLTDLGSFIERHQLTTMWLTAGLFTQMVEHQADSLRGLTWLMTGGDTVSPRHVRELMEAKGRVTLVNGYGPVENTVFTCCHPMTSAEGIDHDVPLGAPIANTQVHVLDDRLRAVPVGVAGELCAGGDGVARDYHRRPALTAARFVPDPCSGLAGARLYRTGDLARWRDDGTVQFLGRIDRQVKVRGFRVDLSELEATIEAHPAVRAAVVVPREDAAGTKQLVAYLVTDGPADAAAGVIFELRRRLHARLPDHMVPSVFEPIDALPLTPNGKADRRALPEPGGADALGQAAFAPPRDPVELQLVHIWEDVLDRRGIGRHDNFFELGGHSILAISLIARIEAHLGRRLPIAMVMERPTIELQADLLRQGAEAAPPTVVVAIQPRGRRRPLFCVHPGGGTAFCYVPLAFHLGADQPVYGIQAVGTSGEREPLTRIEEMAALYVEAMRRTQPEGPYQIAGWSLGGMIAFEMARQLGELGHTVALVALIDGYAPTVMDIPPDVDEAMILRELAREVAGWSDGPHQAETTETGVAADMRALKTLIEPLPADASEQHLRRMLTVFKANLHAAGAYVPRRYAGKVTILRARDADDETAAKDPTLGWEPHVAGELEIHVFPGDHFGPIREPQGLAEVLERCLGSRP